MPGGIETAGGSDNPLNLKFDKQKDTFQAGETKKKPKSYEEIIRDEGYEVVRESQVPEAQRKELKERIAKSEKKRGMGWLPSLTKRVHKVTETATEQKTEYYLAMCGKTKDTYIFGKKTKIKKFTAEEIKAKKKEVVASEEIVDWAKSIFYEQGFKQIKDPALAKAIAKHKDTKLAGNPPNGLAYTKYLVEDGVLKKEDAKGRPDAWVVKTGDNYYAFLGREKPGK